MKYKLSLKNILTNKQTWMKQDDEDTGIGIKLVPGSYGMNVPSTYTIVIIAGIDIKNQSISICFLLKVIT